MAPKSACCAALLFCFSWVFSFFSSICSAIRRSNSSTSPKASLPLKLACDPVNFSLKLERSLVNFTSNKILGESIATLRWEHAWLGTKCLQFMKPPFFCFTMRGNMRLAIFKQKKLRQKRFLTFRPMILFLDGP